MSMTCLLLYSPATLSTLPTLPQGMYDSIKDASVLKVPIYITETGSADKEGRHRKYMIDGHSKAVRGRKGGAGQWWGGGQGLGKGGRLAAGGTASQ